MTPDSCSVCISSSFKCYLNSLAVGFLCFSEHPGPGALSVWSVYARGSVVQPHLGGAKYVRVSSNTTLAQKWKGQRMKSWGFLSCLLYQERNCTFLQSLLFFPFQRREESKRKPKESEDSREQCLSMGVMIISVLQGAPARTTGQRGFVG